MVVLTPSLNSYFSVLKKCQTKFDCLLYEMFFMKELKPVLKRTPFELSFLLDCVSRVNSITLCSIIQYVCVHFSLFSLLGNDLSQNVTFNLVFLPFHGNVL